MSGKIFINYRRDDEAAAAGRLFDRLNTAFNPDQLFMDVDNIAPGHDFVRVLEEQVGLCDVLLVMIGRQWLSARDRNGDSRLANPGKRIIPVLINNAQMPRPESLPESLRPLTRRNAVRLTHERFHADAQSLIKVLETALAEEEAARNSATAAEAQELQRRQDVEEVGRLQRDWALAGTLGTVQAYKAFIAKWPASSKIKMARARIKELGGGQARQLPMALGLVALLLASALVAAFMVLPDYRASSDTGKPAKPSPEKATRLSAPFRVFQETMVSGQSTTFPVQLSLDACRANCEANGKCVAYDVSPEGLCFTFSKVSNLTPRKGWVAAVRQ